VKVNKLVKVMGGWGTVLKLAAVGVCLMVALQVIFYFVFQIIGYDSFWLSITLIASILVFVAILVSGRVLKKLAD
jgi:uncharacterized membrane protein